MTLYLQIDLSTLLSILSAVTPLLLVLYVRKK
jgi:hypothetical protein